MYVLPLVGRHDEALQEVKRLQARPLPEVMRLFVDAACAVLDGRPGDTVTIVRTLRGMQLFDPEGVFIAARILADVGETPLALDLLEDVVARGFFCPSILHKDPWLARVRAEPRFQVLLASAETRSQEAGAEFKRLGGDRLLAL